MLTPMEIHDHQFRKSFRGYSENEVDDFLDRIVEDFEKLLRENERLKNQLNSTEKELDHYRKLEKTLKDTLMVAQRTADEVISSAKKNAEELKTNTARECQTIREEARLEARKQISSAASKRDAILTEYDRFVREKNAFLVKMRTILESELSITVQMLEDIPKVDEAVKTILPEEDIPAKNIPASETSQIESEPPAQELPPVEEIPPEPEPEQEEIPPVDDKHSNIVDISSKPVTDGTKTYKPVKPKLDKESSK